MTYLSWLFSAQTWAGSADNPGIGQRLVEHLGLSLIHI